MEDLSLHILDVVENSLRAGAKRVRFVESSWATAGPLEEFMLDSGWNVRQLLAAAPGV